MGLFSKPRFLGIDFGTSSLKAVEVEFDGVNALLVNYGEADFSAFNHQLNTVAQSYDEAITLYLRALLEKLQPKTDKVHAAMPAYTGLISLIRMPVMEAEELAEAIQFEAHKHIPTALEEVALSWEVVGTPGNNGEQHLASAETVILKEERQMQEVLLVAALKKEVARYQGYIEVQGLQLALLELETFSLTRSLIGNQPGTHLLVDIGSRATNMVLVENGTVKVSRNIDVGGKDLTRTLSESMNISRERAEELKRSGKDFLNSPESAIVFPALELIVGEVRRMMEAHQTSTGGEVTAVLLSGGSSKFAGIATFLERMIGHPVRLADPWQRVIVAETDQDIITALGASYAVAVGLALGGIEVAKKQEEEAALGKKMKKFLSFKIG